MADVASNLYSWSTTAASNSPAGGTAVGTGLDDNLREIQAVVRQDLASLGADIASATTTDLGAVAGLKHNITGTTTITGFGTVASGIWKILKFGGALTLTHNATSLILPGAANITTAANDVAIVISEGSGNWRCVSYWPAATSGMRDLLGFGTSLTEALTTLPTRQVFTSGSGTYTTPTGATYIKLRMIGGGGGGGGSGTASNTDGGAGGDSTFSTYTAGGGASGAKSTGAALGAGGAGGTASGSPDFSVSGGPGSAGVAYSGTVAANCHGGNGGNGALGGAGTGLTTGNGTAGATNTGSGGAGGSGTASTFAAAGGGSGAYLEVIITSPSATYSYSVGAAGTAGTAGTSGAAGGAGGSGLIIVDEFYN